MFGLFSFRNKNIKVFDGVLKSVTVIQLFKEFICHLQAFMINGRFESLLMRRGRT